MKYEPITIAVAYVTASMASVHLAVDPREAILFNGAVAAGGFLTLLFSLWKSRKKKADRFDTALWATIGFVGSMALSFFGAPLLQGRNIIGTEVPISLPFAGFLIAISAAPFIEWALEGGPFKLAKDILDTWRKSRDCG